MTDRIVSGANQHPGWRTLGEVVAEVLDNIDVARKARKRREKRAQRRASSQSVAPEAS